MNDRYTPDLVVQIWKKANTVSGYDSQEYRKDVCGAWIRFSKYGDRSSKYGWEIDHCFPEKLIKDKDKAKADNTVNLRPMHWKNNVSKGDDFPAYYAATTSDGNINVDLEPNKKRFIISEDQVHLLEELYNNNQ